MDASEPRVESERADTGTRLASLSRSLSFRQARVAVLVAFSLGVVFSIFQIQADLRSERERTEATFQRILRVADYSAVQAAFGLDDVLAQRVVDGLFEYGAVFQAEIMDNHHDSMARRQRPEKQGRMKPLAVFLFGPAKTFSLPLQVRENNFDVGTLQVSVDTFVIAETFFERSGLILLSGVARNFLLAGILGVLFHFMLTRPLKAVAAHINTHHASVPIPKTHEEDELGELITAYNDQFYQRAAAQERLHRLNKGLENRVTERTEQIELARAELERRVAERTAELMKAIEMAENASRTKSEFLAHMSHELRTPLNAIMGFSQIWKDEMFGALGHPKYKEYAGDINTAGEHLLSLITDILDVSKVEAGEMKLDETTVNVSGLIADCEILVRDTVAKKNIRFTTEVAPEVNDITADARLLRQVVLNLLTNAVKFTAEGGEIGVKACLTAHGAVEIIITDNGCGIKQDDIARVLEPFGQVRRQSELSHEGTGLGLPLAKRYTELHGGLLTLESIFGEGTTVRVIMPASRT